MVTIDELLGGVRNALQGCPGARFEPEACDPALLPTGQDPANMSCGFLVVPENRGSQNGRTIKLAVATLRATGATPEPDPIVLLSGGPGQWALDSVLPVLTADFAAPLQSKRDLVIFDQRGTGRSQPALNCPEVLPQRDSYTELLTPEQEANRDARNLIACHDRLTQEGNDLTGYSSVATARDIADLMTALGIGSVPARPAPTTVSSTGPQIRCTTNRSALSVRPTIPTAQDGPTAPTNQRSTS